MICRMLKFITILSLVLFIAQNVQAENKIKQTLPQKELIILPNSTKLYICQKYSTISSDHCEVIKNYFNSLMKD